MQKESPKKSHNLVSLKNNSAKCKRKTGKDNKEGNKGNK